MKMKIGACVFVAALIASAQVALPNVLFTDDMSSGTNWTMAAGSDTAYAFGYDYSVDGIPAAPRGSDTIGLKLEANVSLGAATYIAATRDMFSEGYVSGMPYTIEVDIWANYELASGTSTEFAGAFAGHDGVTAGYKGAGLMYTGDGGSSYDYRLQKDGGLQYPASFQYNPAMVNNNNTDATISAAFPSVDVGAATGNQQVGIQAAGIGGFQWMTMLIEVDPLAIGSGVTSDPGLAKFTLTSAASNNTLWIGTIDNSNGGTVVNMEGSLALVYADIYSSLSLAPQFQFGLYDNVEVTMIPEPATIALLGFGGLALLRRKR